MSAILLFLIGRIYESIIFSFFEPLKQFDFESYLFSSLVSFSTCLILSSLFSLNLKSRALRRSIKTLSIFVFILICSVNFYTLKEFEEFVSADMVNFIRSSPGYIFGYANTYFLLPTIALLGTLIGSLYYILEKLRERITIKSLGIRTLVSILVILGLLNHINITQKQFLLTQEASTLLAIRNSILKKGIVKRLYKSKSRIMPSTSNVADSQPNYLLIINESWAKQYLSYYDSDSKGFHRTENALRALNGPSTVLDNAYTNSTATDLSLPSILTGVAPHESIHKTHKMPFIWDWAKANGYETYLISSQNLNWANFNLFFQSEGLDHRITATESDLPIINDYGVDDYAFIVEFAKKYNLKTEKPKFIVFFSNALHIPFQVESAAPFDRTLTSRYEKALDILDLSLELLIKNFSSVSPSGLKIIITSDHGENHLPSHTARLNNFFPEIINIPTILSGFSTSKPIDGNTENIDIVPTFLDDMKICLQNKAICDNLTGRSLLQHSRTEKQIISTNTNEYRDWENKAFAIIRGDKHFIYNNKKGSYLFDKKADKDFEHNLWKTSKKDHWLDIIQSNEKTKYIFQNH